MHIIFKTLLIQLQEVYELASWTKMFKMFLSTSQSEPTVVHQVYSVQRAFKVSSLLKAKGNVQ